MKRPAGKCRWCGAELMSRQALGRHEAATCPHRPKAETEAPPDPEERPRWRQVTQAGNAVGWIRE